MVYGCYDVVVNSASIDPEKIEEAVVFERWFIPSFLIVIFICLWWALFGELPPPWGVGLIVLVHTAITMWFVTKRWEQRRLKQEARLRRGQFWLAAALLRLLRR
jgi:hypothetical protein